MYPNPESADTPQRIPGLFDPELWLQRPNHALLNDCVGKFTILESIENI